MVRIKVKRSISDELEKCTTPRLSRREFIERGILTGTMAVAIPKIIAGTLIKEAMADLPTCPSSTRKAVGGPLFFYPQGGMTVGAYFLSKEEAEIVSDSAEAGRRYGINRTDVEKLGDNLYWTESSIFARAVRRAGLDLGYTADEWNALLRKCNAGFNNGPWNQDDGGGLNRGQNVALSPGLRNSEMGRSLLFNTDAALADFAQGAPVSRLPNNATPEQLARLFSISPAGQMNRASMENAAKSAHNLGEIFKSLLGMDRRSGANESMVAATCGFLGDAVMTDPNYGSSLFDPANIAPLRNRIMNLSNRERSWLSAAYNANMGLTSGTNVELDGFDYHNNAPNAIGSRSIEAARLFAMWLAAADAAKTDSVFCMVSNGQAIANGFTPNVTIGNVNGNVQIAVGDAGGAHNKGVQVHFSNSGSPPKMKTLGVPDTVNGNWRAIAGDTLSMKGLVASALMSLNRGSITDQQLRLLGLTRANLATVGLLG